MNKRSRKYFKETLPFRKYRKDVAKYIKSSGVVLPDLWGPLNNMSEEDKRQMHKGGGIITATFPEQEFEPQGLTPGSMFPVSLMVGRLYDNNI